MKYETAKKISNVNPLVVALFFILCTILFLFLASIFSVLTMNVVYDVMDGESAFNQEAVDEIEQYVSTVIVYGGITIRNVPNDLNIGIEDKDTRYYLVISKNNEKNSYVFPKYEALICFSKDFTLESVNYIACDLKSFRDKMAASRMAIHISAFYFIILIVLLLTLITVLQKKVNKAKE